MDNYEKEYSKIVKQPPTRTKEIESDKKAIRKYSRLKPVEISYSNNLGNVQASQIE